jgi:hypothetical protein
MPTKISSLSNASYLSALPEVVHPCQIRLIILISCPFSVKYSGYFSIPICVQSSEDGSRKRKFQGPRHPEIKLLKNQILLKMEKNSATKAPRHKEYPSLKYEAPNHK